MSDHAERGSGSPPADSQASEARRRERPLQDVEYTRLAAFRTELRRFLHWSESAARQAGLTPSLHQLLLVVRGHPGPAAPTVGDAAEALRVRHHSAVELAQRAEAAGLITRGRDATDHRRMRLAITPLGSERLEALTREHLPQIAALAEALDAVAGDPEPGESTNSAAVAQRPYGTLST